MPDVDPIFNEPRLADIYDRLEPDRPDLEPYLAMVDEFGARSVLDIGYIDGDVVLPTVHLTDPNMALVDPVHPKHIVLTGIAWQ